MSFFAAVDLNGLLQFIVTIFILGGCFLYLVKNTASNYFLVEEETDCYNNNVTDWSSAASSSSCTSTSAAATTFSNRNSVVAETTGNMGGERLVDEACAVCGNRTKKFCSRCKMVNYCSAACQTSHWKSEHKKKCGDLKLSGSLLKKKVSGGSCNIMSRAKKILFPYEEFVEFFNWDKPGFPPCGLINCGNSCFANVVLQCLAYTKPLVAFLLEKGHRRECRRNDWCFLCEFQNLVERASQSSQPFSPINILSRLPNMGGNLGYGKQEDAHEFMRFAIDTMQSACLDKFGGEKALHPSSQETTLIQHIFGGHLQSQVICTKCKNVSNQFENMMDLTVEIHGDAASLEECLDQFTAKEWLHGDNMYKCDGCNDYVMAWKRLTVRCAPNILTIALKRFQSGRFGKLNKRVTFPETLDLSPYMSEGGGQDSSIYKLYAVIVHLDMLNASFFGHYVCYIKDFRGNWYRIDDCKVISVGLDEVLSQGAYMLLYSRICARSSSLYPDELSEKSEPENVKVEMDVIPSSVPPVSEEYTEESCSTVVSGLLLPSEEILEFKDTNGEETLSSSKSYSEDVKLDLKEEDLLHKSVDSMDVDTHEEGSRANGQPSSSEPAHTTLVGDNMSAIHSDDADVIKFTLPSQPSPSEPAHTMLIGDNMSAIHSDDADVVKFTLPSSSPLVEGGNGGLTVGATESSFSDSYDVPVATENHVDAEENIPVSVSSAASTSDLVCNERESTNNGEQTVNTFTGHRESTNNGEQTVNTFTGHPQRSVVPDAGGLLNGRRSRSKSKPLLSPGFLDKHRPKKSMKQEGEVLGLGEQVPNSKLNFQTNGVVKPEPMKQESCCTVVSGSLLPSEEISEFKEESGEERLSSSVRYSEDVRMDLEVEDLQHNSVDSMDVDICEEEGSRAKTLPSEPVHTMVLGDNLSSRVNSNNSDVVNFTTLCSSSVVEDRNVGLTGAATESSFTDTYVPVATGNHVDADASTSSFVCNEQGSNSNGVQTVKTSSGDPQRVVLDAWGTLNGRLSKSPSKPLLSPGFLDKRQPKKLTKQKGEVL